VGDPCFSKLAEESDGLGEGCSENRAVEAE
jgi:hypothetical protein